MNKTILVTGGCGFVGASLVPYLRERGYRVRVFDNLSRGHREFLAGVEHEFIKGDIRDLAAAKAAAQGCDAVIHLAAYGSVVESITDPETNFDINARGTFNMLEAARTAGIRKFIFASTGGALIGDAEPPVSEDSVPKPVSPYGASKLCGEAYCNAFAGAYGIETVMLRFANIYGPVSAHKKGAVTVFCKALMTDTPFTIFGDGKATRDFLHVRDLCKGITLALEKSLPPATTLHLATGRETSVGELAQILIAAAGKANHPIDYRPARQGEVLRNFANYDKARAVLGFEPSYRLEEGMKECWEWFRAQGEAALNVETTDS